MEAVFRELKQSLRGFVRAPAFTLTALAALALGIGANTAVFSLVDTVLLKPIHAPSADRLVQLRIGIQGRSHSGGSAHEFFYWRQQTELFQDVSAVRRELLNLTGSGDPQQLPTARVNAEFFHLFRAPLARGRTFNIAEDRFGGPHVVVLSYGLWSERFGKNPRIIGQAILLSGEPYTVVGILGPGFNSEQFDEPPEAWIPYQMDPNSTDGDCYCSVIARLKPGITLGMANVRLKVVAQDYLRAFPGPPTPRFGFVVAPLRDTMVGDVRPLLSILLVAVGFVLLIACTNVASLLLVRANGRQHEIAIRAALGASRGRLIRQLIAESALLSLAGGACGLAIGLGGIHAILRSYPTNPLMASLNVVNIPRIGEYGSGISLDWRVLLFTVVISLLTGVLFGLIPALPASRADLNTVLKESSGRSGTGLR